MNTVQSQFRQALKREGKTITGYYSNETYPCLFRKIDDNNNTTNHIQIFYEKDTPINTGKLLTYGDKVFITLNKESVENDTYFKSSILECNTTLEIVINQRKQFIPCYADDLQNPTVNVGDVISTVEGRIELMTESADNVNSIEFDTAFNILGGTYEIANKYIKSGITYLYVERTLSAPVQEPVYSLTLTSDNTSYEVGKSTTITVNATIDGVLEDNPTLIWTSSDETIATVTNGEVLFLAEGSVTISAEWTEGNKTESIDFNVISVPVSYTFTMTTNNTEIIIGMTSGATFTSSLKDGSGNTVPFTPVWSFNYGGANTSLVTITYPTSTTCRVAAKDDFALIGKSITVTATTNDGLYTVSKTLPFSAGW